jgi:hypothetical protein
MARTSGFVPDAAGFTALLESPGVTSELERRGSAILNAAGGEQAGFEMVTRTGDYGGSPRTEVTIRPNQTDPKAHGRAWNAIRNRDVLKRARQSGA